MMGKERELRNKLREERDKVSGDRKPYTASHCNSEQSMHNCKLFIERSES